VSIDLLGKRTSTVYNAAGQTVGELTLDTLDTPRDRNGTFEPLGSRLTNVH
jgi:hypothetical protein